ncbi:MAG: protein kinase [Deltaproteobacteria bacterium]|nr:protein kinase [Deltaproteobacteria bacterium]
MSSELTKPDTSGEERTPSQGRIRASDTIERGVPVGRYLLIEPIGEGGMGVVYAAYDPKLDRRVALKLVRDDQSAGERHQARLLREAHAMAKLSHPNVVPIYDVGTFGGRVFLALELVDGAALDDWIEAAKRTPQEVLDVFVEAARGLAAAHDAGLVHRDFKPANVLVGKDGRVRVTDFGLARVDRSDSGEAFAGDEAGEQGPLDQQLTVAGVVMGTPAYMAPEQRRAIAADARSDQFSFCVALYEALYGKHPFAGDDDTRWAAIEAGQLREPPKGTRVSPHVRRVLARGLAVDPEDRHASMEALIAALRADPTVVRRRLAIRGGITLAVVGALGTVWAVRDPSTPPCRGSEKLLAGVWDDPIKATIEARFAVLGKPFATQAWDRTRKTVDDYTSGWIAMRQEVCKATRVRGDQSEPVMTLRMTCLDHRLDRLRALTTALVAADSDAVVRAADAARSLERLADCADVAALENRIKPPDDARAGQVAAMRTRLDELQITFDLGKYEAGRFATTKLAAEAAQLGYRALEAEVQELRAMYLRQGGLQDEEPAWIAAFHAAEAARDERRKARIALRLAHASSFAKLDFKRAAEWLDLGAAIIEAIGGDRELEGLLLHERGNLYIRQGQYAESLIWYRKALAVRQQVSGGQWAVMETLHNIGIAEKEVGSVENALEALVEATEIVQTMLGPSHPELVEELENLSWVQIAAGKDAAGLVSAQQALELATQVLGPDHPRTGVAMLYAASALNVAKRFDEGARLAHRAIELVTDVERRLDAHTVEGKALAGLGRHREALATLDIGLADAEKGLGPTNPALSRVLAEIGTAHLALGNAAAAIPPLERGLALRKDMSADSQGEIAFVLGTAVWKVGKDRDRALALIRRARAAFGGVPSRAKDLAEIDAWISRSAKELATRP